MRVATDTTWPGVFTEALRGEACLVHGLRRSAYELPVTAWRAEADESDRALLRHCSGTTLDVGCGPGRMVQALAADGVQALGIDVVPEAIDQARARGIAALLRDVFDPLPGEGAWGSVLLADGNIGIGGDPVRLLRRVHALLAPGGSAVVDLAPPGSGLRTRLVAIECGAQRSEPFAWALVGPESVRDLAAHADFVVGGLHEHDGRWFAVLDRRDP